MSAVISFCIMVYNQYGLVKECIDSIVPYKGDDIEIIISDDCSTENIEKLIESYEDARIKYHRNDTNLGHDRNIVASLKRASGKYAFVLRTRDKMIATAIPNLINVARISDASYITACAVNQDGSIKIQYTKGRFKKGSEALAAHYKLFIHPSGNMYRLKDLQLEKLQKFIEQQDLSKTSFIVHNLIRVQLAVTGDFQLISEPSWIYTDTEKAKDKAVNHASEGLSVYDPSLVEKRYIDEMKWSKVVLEEKYIYSNFLMLTSLYLDQATWNFKLINSDKRVQHHYSFTKSKFSVKEEREHFKSVSVSLYDELKNVERKKFDRDLERIFKENRLNGAIKYTVRYLTNGTPLYNYLAKIYKKHCSRL